MHIIAQLINSSLFPHDLFGVFFLVSRQSGEFRDHDRVEFPHELGSARLVLRRWDGWLWCCHVASLFPLSGSHMTRSASHTPTTPPYDPHDPHGRNAVVAATATKLTFGKLHSFSSSFG